MHILEGEEPSEHQCGTSDRTHPVCLSREHLPSAYYAGHNMAELMPPDDEELEPGEKVAAGVGVHVIIEGGRWVGWFNEGPPPNVRLVSHSRDWQMPENEAKDEEYAQRDYRNRLGMGCGREPTGQYWRRARVSRPDDSPTAGDTHFVHWA